MRRGRAKKKRIGRVMEGAAGSLADSLSLFPIGRGDFRTAPVLSSGWVAERHTTMLSARAAAAWLARCRSASERAGDASTTTAAAAAAAAVAVRAFAKTAGGSAAALPAEDRKAANRTALLVKVRIDGEIQEAFTHARAL
jgi:hypothetical protein